MIAYKLILSKAANRTFQIEEIQLEKPQSWKLEGIFLYCYAHRKKKKTKEEFKGKISADV